jgi:glycosyltransferase involved in cell wall biosynthesis
MRILLATDHFPPFIGGAHRQARLLAQAMTERGHEVMVVTPWHGGLPPSEQEGRVVVRRVRQLRTVIPRLVRDKRQRHQPPFPDPVTVRDLRKAIAEVEPDLIHSYGWMTFSVAAALGRRRIPLLVSARDYGYFCANRTLLRKGAPCSGPGMLKCLACTGDYYGAPKGWFAALGVYACKPLLKRKMTGLHSVSTYVQEVTARELALDGDGRPLFEVTIPSFQTEAPLEPIAEAAGLSQWLDRLPAEPFILFVGAFRKVKGLETLFDAYRLLSDPPPLVLMGTYERDSPADFPPQAVVMTDVPHEAVMAAWDRAMFGVMPSLWPEPLGSTVVEGMLRGRPVIGTSIGGHTDMLDEGTGVLVPQGDVVALRRAMEDLIDDPNRREVLGAAAAERAHDFVAASVLPRFEQAYEAVIARGQSAA